ncbi:hypothetical protein PHLH7_03050 [Pseudomonas sp. Ost2]|uniref:PIN domain-containing protein n=1 Tax=Pseudomonas sp. Ost2 TaxID=2678260 RepID=UPI001BB3548C|nr:PIN domain-containing protein [Pseudomonas sp. Ost2]BBP74201.1 hypothetical protein PHLH7_03050 [Pseudomonas sp. Ost2]
MPNGMPTPEQLWNEEIRFFSIDTDIIQAAGYNFEAGALNQLHRQLPSSMELQLTEVVFNEVINHLMEPILKSIQELKSAAANLKRKTDLPMDRVSNLFNELTPAESSRAYFQKRVEDYTQICRGGILATEGDGILGELFRRYFAVDAPFGLKTTKKSEFPDAAALLVLEGYAVDNSTMGIVVSVDGGWQAFASQSEYLYCVKSLDELTTLFKATGEVPSQIQEAILIAIEDPLSPLRAQLNDALSEHIGSSEWQVGEIYTNTGSRVEGEVSDVKIDNQGISIDGIAIWNDEEDPAKWLIEVTGSIRVDVDIYATVFFWDPIDRDEVEIAPDDISSAEDIEVTAFLTCSNVQAGSAPMDWNVEVEIADGEYTVDVGEVNAFPWEE